MDTKKHAKKIIYVIIFFTIMLIHFLVASRFYALTQVVGMDESVTIGWISIASSASLFLHPYSIILHRIR